MLTQLFFDDAPKGALYASTELASGDVNGQFFATLAHPEGLVIRSQEVGTKIIPWAELAKSIIESAHGDGEGWAPMEKAAVSTNRVTGAVVTAEEAGADEVWGNNLYTVHVRRTDVFVHLSIHRHDRAAARDWRHFQRIKNEIVGAEYEALELYPSEARLIDTANQYHLWVPLDEFGGPAPIPLGFDEGRVTQWPDEVAAEHPGAVQRPFDAP